MDTLIIRGGSALKGDVVISGAKNAALPILAASVLASGENSFAGIPDLRDIATMGRLLSTMGCRFDYADGRAAIDTASINSFEATYELVKTMRASVLVLGPLVARYGRARVSLPGGCAIGARPINLHLM